MSRSTLRQLLVKSLGERDAARFSDRHIQNLVAKAYTDEGALQDATREGLRSHPALPSALFDKLLKAFGQSGQRQKSTSFWARPYRQKLQDTPTPSVFGTMWSAFQTPQSNLGDEVEFDRHGPLLNIYRPQSAKGLPAAFASAAFGTFLDQKRSGDFTTAACQTILRLISILSDSYIDTKRKSVLRELWGTFGPQFLGESPGQEKSMLGLVREELLQDIKQLAKGKHVYLITPESGESWVAKVEATPYPEQLHEELSTLGLAPKLVTPVTIYPGGVQVTQMEYLDAADGWVRLERFTGDWDALHEVAMEALKSLQSCLDGKAVHGDLNPSNLLIREPKPSSEVKPLGRPQFMFLDLAWAVNKGRSLTHRLSMPRLCALSPSQMVSSLSENMTHTSSKRYLNVTASNSIHRQLNTSSRHWAFAPSAEQMPSSCRLLLVQLGLVTIRVFILQCHVTPPHGYCTHQVQGRAVLGEQEGGWDLRACLAVVHNIQNIALHQLQ